MAGKLDIIIEFVATKYKYIIDIYQNIQRLEEEIKSIALEGAIVAKPKLEERRALIDELIEEAKNDDFTIFQSVYPKSLDSESDWVINWPIEFLIPANAKNIISEVSEMKMIIEDAGGLFVPHNAGGYYKNNESANTMNILIPPDSIHVNFEVKSATKNISHKVTIIRFISGESIVCLESTNKKPEIAITKKNLTPKIKNKDNQELKPKGDILECRLCFCIIFLG